MGKYDVEWLTAYVNQNLPLSKPAVTERQVRTVLRMLEIDRKFAKGSSLEEFAGGTVDLRVKETLKYLRQNGAPPDEDPVFEQLSVQQTADIWAERAAAEPPYEVKTALIPTNGPVPDEEVEGAVAEALASYPEETPSVDSVPAPRRKRMAP